MQKKILYSDRLVEITGGGILFRTYFFPFGKKKIAWPDMENIEAREPTVLNGKFRIQGTGDFRTWFPRDSTRPKRDTIFIINLHGRRKRIGFTVEDAEKAACIFQSKSLLKECREHVP
jgi:hypothetical protein